MVELVGYSSVTLSSLLIVGLSTEDSSDLGCGSEATEWFTIKEESGTVLMETDICGETASVATWDGVMYCPDISDTWTS